jgi:hypothetical protein
MNNLQFKGPGFEFNAVGPYAIAAAVLIAVVLIVSMRWHLF